jgi:hypothetical protein
MDVPEKCKSQAVSTTKADLITVIADKLKFPWARAEPLVDVVFDCMEQSMSRGENKELRERVNDGRRSIAPIAPHRC